MNSLKVLTSARQMRGEGAPKPTLFGVLGMTKYDSSNKSLGGLIMTSTKNASPADSAEPIKQVKRQTDHHLEGAGHATAVSGQHYGQVPYAGKYMKPLGSRV